jgi:hypothetical protein
MSIVVSIAAVAARRLPLPSDCDASDGEYGRGYDFVATLRIGAQQASTRAQRVQSDPVLGGTLSFREPMTLEIPDLTIHSAPTPGLLSVSVESTCGYCSLGSADVALSTRWTRLSGGGEVLVAFTVSRVDIPPRLPPRLGATNANESGVGGSEISGPEVPTWRGVHARNVSVAGRGTETIGRGERTGWLLRLRLLEADLLPIPTAHAAQLRATVSFAMVQRPLAPTLTIPPRRVGQDGGPGGVYGHRAEWPAAASCEFEVMPKNFNVRLHVTLHWAPVAPASGGKGLTSTRGPEFVKLGVAACDLSSIEDGVGAVDRVLVFDSDRTDAGAELMRGSAAGATVRVRMSFASNPVSRFVGMPPLVPAAMPNAAATALGSAGGYPAPTSSDSQYPQVGAVAVLPSSVALQRLEDAIAGTMAQAVSQVMARLDGLSARLDAVEALQRPSMRSSGYSVPDGAGSGAAHLNASTEASLPPRPASVVVSADGDALRKARPMSRSERHTEPTRAASVQPLAVDDPSMRVVRKFLQQGAIRPQRGPEPTG